MAKIVKLAALVGLGYAGFSALTSSEKKAATKALGFTSEPQNEADFVSLIKSTIKSDKELQRLLTGPAGQRGEVGPVGPPASIGDAMFVNSRMILPNNGAIDLNGTNNRFRFWNDTNQIVLTSFDNTGANIADVMTIGATGTISKIGGGSFAALSDERLKENIEAFTSGLEKILSIETKTFNYKKVKGTQTEFYPDFLTQKKQYGVIAQQLQAVCPEMVTEGEDGYLTVDLSSLSLLLVNAVKELDKKDKDQQKLITSQAAKIKALEDQQALMLERLTALEAK